MSGRIDEALVREVIEEVLGRLGSDGAVETNGKSSGDCGCSSRSNGGLRGTYGVHSTADAACEAAAEAFEQLREKGVEARQKVVEIVKGLCETNAQEWGRLELEESKIGRLDHKIAKLEIIKLVPGVEFLKPYALSGDHGITLEEYTPFGVVGAVTPSTHSVPTIAGNVVNMVAAGNAVVFNPHPAASRCAATATRVFNEAIYREIGIENLINVIESPTLDSFKEMCSHEAVRLLCVTGGPGVVKSAMQTGKRAICAGPGNPPVLVDATADIRRAAGAVIQGAAFDNNLLCIGEKEVFVVDAIYNEFIQALRDAGAYRLSDRELEQLTGAAFDIPEGTGAGCAAPRLNKDLIGKDASVLARAAGASVPNGTELLFAETDANHLFVQEEQMMPCLPIVRVRDVREGIEKSLEAEHGYRHTSIIHSHDVSAMTSMGRAMDTTLFVKNGPSMAGLGLGGEGYLSYSIATPTGEGVTTPKTFTRTRRCCMVDNLRIY